MFEIDDVIDRFSGLCRKALDYTRITKEAVDAAKQPNFSEASWDKLAKLVNMSEFRRVGNFKEVMTWPEYLEFLTAWAPTAEWECSFKRAIESGNLAVLELEERTRAGDFSSVVNSVSVYEFDESERICKLGIFLQTELPSPELLDSYKGIEIGG